MCRSFRKCGWSSTSPLPHPSARSLRSLFSALPLSHRHLRHRFHHWLLTRSSSRGVSWRIRWSDRRASWWTCRRVRYRWIRRFQLIGNRPLNLHKDIFGPSFDKLAIPLSQKGVFYQACSPSWRLSLPSITFSSFCEGFYSFSFCSSLISYRFLTISHFIRNLASPSSSVLAVGSLLIIQSFQITHHSFLLLLISQRLHYRIHLRPSLGSKVSCEWLDLSSIRLWPYGIIALMELV